MMSSVLFIMLQAHPMTEGAAEMAQSDPHGVILSVICIFVVFAALLILDILYSFIGKASNDEKTKKEFRKAKKKLKATKEAITPASSKEQQMDEEVAAAIAIALEDYFNEESHDKESYVLTISNS